MPAESFVDFFIPPAKILIMSVEQPAYETLKQDGSFEVRRYNGYVLAHVDVEADFDTALNEGFRALFGYITGHNRVRTKVPLTMPATGEVGERTETIPMTVPVIMEPRREGVYRVGFIMPGRYTLETLPRPDNESIGFTEIPDHKVAVIRFSGHSHEPKVREKIGELKDWLRGNDLEPKSSFRLARYDPPWIPGFLRHNEIMVDV
ncbi:SOUL family heme-binding protein [Methanocella arvoryzae]|nr:heme-binding protein [Methanocella arvoryzae]